MGLHNLKSIQSKSRTRVGRGISAGQGKTAGRGTKGQKSRSGYNIPRRFEGGQTPLLQRLPKFHGTKSYKKKPQTVSWRELEAAFSDGAAITLEELWNHGLISNITHPVKILGSARDQESADKTSRATKTFKFAEPIQMTKALAIRVQSKPSA